MFQNPLTKKREHKLCSAPTAEFRTSLRRPSPPPLPPPTKRLRFNNDVHGVSFDLQQPSDALTPLPKGCFKLPEDVIDEKRKKVAGKPRPTQRCWLNGKTTQIANQRKNIKRRTKATDEPVGFFVLWRCLICLLRRHLTDHHHHHHLHLHHQKKMALLITLMLLLIMHH